MLLKANIRRLAEEFADNERKGNSSDMIAEMEQMLKIEEPKIDNQLSSENSASEDDMMAAIMNNGSL